MSRVTAVVQIGNTDDKLTQKDWAAFIRDVHKVLIRIGQLHFSGFSIPDAVWQNACWVAEIHIKDILVLKRSLGDLTIKYKQDSIALTIGETEFVWSVRGK